MKIEFLQKHKDMYTHKTYKKGSVIWIDDLRGKHFVKLRIAKEVKE